MRPQMTLSDIALLETRRRQPPWQRDTGKCRDSARRTNTHGGIAQGACDKAGVSFLACLTCHLYFSAQGG